MLGTIIYNLFITPIEYIIEIVFALISRLLDDPGLAIIAISVVVSVLCLPLYKRADAIQDEERKKQDSMSHWVDHIKKNFKGDERYMMLTTYYRHQGYKPINSLKSSISLLLQIPFFIAAYHYLSNLSSIQGVNFWIFSDLGSPDSLFSIGTFNVNVLPIIMTIINVAAAYVYLKGFPLSQKIQTYALALIFLVLLYNSPSGLVIYWTCNQIFSLIKNIFLRIVTNKKVSGACIMAAGVILFLLVALTGHLSSPKKIIFMVLVLLVCCIPFCMAFKKEKPKDAAAVKTVIPARLFLLGGVFFTLFIGAVVPLSVISSSAVEFVTNSNEPGNIIAYTVSLAAGYFLVWAGIFYFMATPGIKNLFSYIYFAFAGISLLDFFFFAGDLGFISTNMIYDDMPAFESSVKLINAIICLAAAVLLCLTMKYLKKIIQYVWLVLIMCIIGLIVTNAAAVVNDIKEADIEEAVYVEDAEVEFSLTTEGQNVILVMLDRSSSCYLPYILNEMPELAEQFSGFTYYYNTISFGGVTCVASPALFGGYDYMPVKLNERDDEYMIDKQVEALKVIPAIFGSNGYSCTIADSPFPGRYNTSYNDQSVFDDLENTNAVAIRGKYITSDTEKLYPYIAAEQNRNMFFYSIMKAVPLYLHNTVYDLGRYFSTNVYQYSTEEFITNYSEFEALPYMTGITESSENTYIMIDSLLSHSPSVADTESYQPAAVAENEIRGDLSRFDLDGNTLDVSTSSQIGHYNALAASLKLLGEWMEYLKENNVYDNTRIIICGDHGINLYQDQTQTVNDELSIQKYNPLLMIKDFGETGEIKTSDEFMTNADVPSLLFEGLIEDPVNPFTSNAITTDSKYTEDLLVTTSASYNLTELQGYHVIGYTNGDFWQVTPGNIRDGENWLKTDITVDAY